MYYRKKKDTNYFPKNLVNDKVISEDTGYELLLEKVVNNSSIKNQIKYIGREAIKMLLKNGGLAAYYYTIQAVNLGIKTEKVKFYFTVETFDDLLPRGVHRNKLTGYNKENGVRVESKSPRLDFYFHPEIYFGKEFIERFGITFYYVQMIDSNNNIKIYMDLHPDDCLSPSLHDEYISRDRLIPEGTYSIKAIYLQSYVDQPIINEIYRTTTQKRTNPKRTSPRISPTRSPRISPRISPRRTRQRSPLPRGILSPGILIPRPNSKF